MPATQQVVLVTGASSGIGKATALKLLDEGHVVYCAARRIERMQDLVASGRNSADAEGGIASCLRLSI